MTHGCEKWTAKKLLWGERNECIPHLRRALWIWWMAKMTNTLILGQINPECSMEANMTNLRWSYLGHILKDSLEKTITLGEKSSRKRGRLNMRRLDSIKKNTALCKMVINGKTFWRTLAIRSLYCKRDSIWQPLTTSTCHGGAMEPKRFGYKFINSWS